MKKRHLIHSLILTMVFNPLAAFAGQTVPAEPPIKERPHRYAAIVIDAETSTVLFSRDAQQSLHPASTTKVMTFYLAAEAKKKGEFSFDEKLPVSVYAASRERTNLNLMAPVRSVTTVMRKGKKVQKVTWVPSNRNPQPILALNAIKGMIVHSANDAAVILAERLGGSEENFVRMMNAKAKELGMTNTTFGNPNGLPNPVQRTTVEDMAKLSQALIRDFPEDYKLFNSPTFTFNGTTYRNFNKLLDTYPGADGIKTGTINASGSNLLASAVRDGHRIIGVVFGASSAKQRNSDMTYLLDYGFAKRKDPNTVFTEPPKVTVEPGKDDNNEGKEGFGTPVPVPPSEELLTPSTDSGITVRIKITPRSSPQAGP